jgi:hypothetical protein
MSFLAVFITDIIAFFNFSLFPRLQLLSFLLSQKIPLNSYSNSKINNINFNSNNNNVNNNLFVFSLRDKSKCYFYWTTWGQFKNKYPSYETFKENWDSKRIKGEIVEDYKNGILRIKVFKNTFLWFLNHRNSN